MVCACAVGDDNKIGLFFLHIFLGLRTFVGIRSGWKSRRRLEDLHTLRAFMRVKRPTFEKSRDLETSEENTKRAKPTATSSYDVDG